LSLSTTLLSLLSLPPLPGDLAPLGLVLEKNGDGLDPDERDEGGGTDLKGEGGIDDDPDERDEGGGTDLKGEGGIDVDPDERDEGGGTDLKGEGGIDVEVDPEDLRGEEMEGVEELVDREGDLMGDWGGSAEGTVLTTGCGFDVVDVVGPGVVLDEKYLEVD